MGLIRWDNCFIRHLDNLIQVLATAGGSALEPELRVPVGIRYLAVVNPAGWPHATVPCSAENSLGRIASPLANMEGLEVASAPRSGALLANTK